MGRERGWCIASSNGRGSGESSVVLDYEVLQARRRRSASDMGGRDIAQCMSPCVHAFSRGSGIHNSLGFNWSTASQGDTV